MVRATWLTATGISPDFRTLLQEIVDEID